MEFYKNLLKKNEKNPLRLFIGLLFLIVAILWVVSKRWDNEPITLFDWIYSLIFALNALVHIMGGLGVPIEGFMGKAFIKVDSNQIQVKPGIFKKEQTADWNTVQSIDNKGNQLVIVKNDNSNLNISFTDLEYSIVQEIKSALTDIANKKGINNKL